MNSGVEIGMLFIVTTTLFIRSILVPSSWWRSLCIGTFTATPTGAAVWIRKGAFIVDQSPTMISMFLAFAMVWLVIVVSLSAYTSALIFGLHQQIRAVTQLGQYTLERKLGEGAMGAVYLGRHVLLRRTAAIKILRRSRPGTSDLSRFEHEVRITSSLSHPNTVSVLDYGWTDGGVFYYVMQYLDGINLDTLVREYGPQPASRVVHLLRQACGALALTSALREELVFDVPRDSNCMLHEMTESLNHRHHSHERLFPTRQTKFTPIKSPPLPFRTGVAFSSREMAS